MTVEITRPGVCVCVHVQTQSLITFYDLHDVTVGVDASDVFGMGGVDATVEDQRYGNREQRVCVS